MLISPMLFIVLSMCFGGVGLEASRDMGTIGLALADRSRLVAARPFPFQDGKEKVDGVLFLRKAMGSGLAASAALSDPAPSARQAGLAEKRFGNLHCIVARHVPSRISTFDMKLIGLSDHIETIAFSGSSVQREF